MNAAVEPRRLRVVSGTADQRRRLAIIIGFVLAVILAGWALIALGPGSDANQMVVILRAAKPIQAGTTITADQITTGQLRTNDPGFLATFLRDSDKSRIIGQVAAMDVPVGDAIPAGVTAAQSTAGMLKVNVPVRIMPADLAAGDHVDMLVSVNGPSGSPVDLVFLQDVRVLQVGQGSAELWIPAKLFAQTIWYSDHGGVVLATLQPGDVQKNLPAGGSS